MERSEELQQKVRIAEEKLACDHQHLSKQSDFGCGDEDSPSMRSSSDWHGRDGIWRPPSDGAACWVANVGEPRRGTTGRCRRRFPRRRRGRTIGPSQERKVARERRFSEAGQGGGLQTRDLTKRSELNAEVVGEARRDMEELVSSFRTVKKRRACPAGSHACRALDGAPSRLSEFVARRSGHRLTRGRKLCRCSLHRWWRGSCVELGLQEQRRWRGTTAPVLLCIRATRRAPREREWCMCYLLWASSSSKFH